MRMSVMLSSASPAVPTAMATSSTALIPVRESTEDHVDRHSHIIQAANTAIPLIARTATAVRMTAMGEPWTGSRNLEGRGRTMTVAVQRAPITAGGVPHRGVVRTPLGQAKKMATAPMTLSSAPVLNVGRAGRRRCAISAAPRSASRASVPGA